MTIGFDGSRAFIQRRTGTENYSYQLLKALAKIDRRNSYIVYVRSFSVIARYVHVKLNVPWQSSRSVEDPHVVESDSTPQDDKGVVYDDETSWPENFQFKVINWPRLWTQAGLAVQTFKDKLDALFVPAHTLPLIRKPGLKTVMTVHDLGSEYLSSLHQVKQRLYLSFIQRFQLTTANYLISVSNATKEDLIKRIKINPKKITVIYEGFDKEKFKVQSVKFKVDQTLKKYNLQYQKYFLFVGTVQPRKNLERLIQAFSIHLRGVSFDFAQDKQAPGSHLDSRSYGTLGGGVTLAIVGPKGWLSDEIYKLPEKLGIEERVKFLGYVLEKDLPNLYCGAIALTYPSLFEGFGLPIIEAQACGCPVLTSNLSSMPEIAGKGAVYVNPYDIDDIVKGMTQVQSSFFFRKFAKANKFKVQIVKAGFENVKRFSWEKCAKETLRVLEEIAG